MQDVANIQILKLSDFRFKNPYLASGRCSYRYIEYNKPGVYIILRNWEIVYVGMSESNVYRAFYRHFQKWSNASRHRYFGERKTYDRNDGSSYMGVITLLDREVVRDIESDLIQRYKPIDNGQKIQYTKYQEYMKSKKLDDDCFVADKGVKDDNDVPF